FEQIAGELALRPLARLCGFINVRALMLIAAHETLFGHDLHEFQDGAVLRRAAAADDIVHSADRGRADAPKDGEDFEFGVGRPWKIVAHNRKRLLVRFSYVKKKFPAPVNQGGNGRMGSE